MNQHIVPGTKVDHDRYGIGIVNDTSLTSYEIFFANGGKISISKTSDELSAVEHICDADQSAGEEINLEGLEELLTQILDKYGMLQEEVPLGDKWEGGTLILQPGKEGLKSKEIPVESFFHKIVMIRDRMRVLEQNINSSERLSDEEKVHLQQYIFRVYGSLTSFNVLFAEKEHYFKGEGKK